MARERRRLLIAPERLAMALDRGGQLLPEPLEAHYLKRVLRCRPGEAIDVVDGAGRLLPAELQADGGLRLEPQLGSWQPASDCPIQIALALPRREAELVWRMATELGVDGLQPLLAERCQPQPLALERWRTIVREAVEQSERRWLPELATPLAARTWLEAPAPGLALLATTRQADLPELEALLPPPGATALPPALLLAIGPEGGWTPREEEAARRGGWQLVSLGPTILRCSTAAVAAAARLVSWRTLSCAASSRPSPGTGPDPHRPGDDAAEPLPG